MRIVFDFQQTYLGAASPSFALTKSSVLSALKIAALALSIGLVATIPVAFAYGNNTQWQVGLSGTCKVAAYCAGIGLPPGTTGGFWGWCAFGGSSGSSAPGTTGTSGDCQITAYIDVPGSHATNPYHISQDITGWTIVTSPGPASICNLYPANTPCFFVTAATVEFQGPGAPGPTGVVLPSGCSADVSADVGNPACDTGISAVAGHTSLHPAPGVELNIQVSAIGH